MYTIASLCHRAAKFSTPLHKKNDYLTKTRNKCNNSVMTKRIDYDCQQVSIERTLCKNIDSDNKTILIHLIHMCLCMCVYIRRDQPNWS